MSKRNGYISWDEYFMGVALLASQRSKDPSTQVGACIVNDDNRIMSVGYNGFPRGCSDDEFPWEREGDKCRIYVALFPCNECAKAIIQCGIKEVVYISDKYKDTDNVKASKKMFEYAGVKLTHFSSNKKLTIDFDVDTI